MLFEEWVEKYMEAYKQPSVSPNSYTSYQSFVRCHVIPPFEGMRLKDIKPLHCQHALNELSGSSIKMIRRMNTFMNSIFKTAITNGLMLENPSKDLVRPVGTVNSRRSLTDRERQVLLQVAETHRIGLFVKIMLYCGLRPGEVCALQWSAVDLEDAVIHVYQNMKRNGVIGTTKTDAGVRDIPIPEVLLKDLKKVTFSNPFDYVVPNRSGQPYRATSLSKIWKDFKKEMHLALGGNLSGDDNIKIPCLVADDLVLYNLRHTYCTDLQSAGVPINVARELMGHSNIAITSKIYTHHSDKSINDARVLINEFNNSCAPSVATKSCLLYTSPSPRDTR